MACERCPCPEICQRRPRWCEWAAKDPPDPVELRSICERSALGRPPSYPPLAQQAANLAGALGRVVAAAVQGQPVKVPPPVYYERLAICRECEFNGERPFGMRCTKCGCSGIKLHLAPVACPVGKWPRYEEPNDDD